MHIKRMIDVAVEKGDKLEMEKLNDIMVESIYMLKELDYSKYKDLEMKLHKLAYGNHLGEHLAKEWVSEMDNKDGTMGEKWSCDETESVRMQYNVNANKWDWYAVLNMMHSDYYEAGKPTDHYVKLAKDWIMDKDVADGKTLRYYMYVVDCAK